MKRTDLVSVLRGAADILFPRHCLCCHERLATDERFLCELRAAGFFDGIDLLIPIPLARKKERQRGYNQSLWIARGVAKATSIPIDTKSVVRTVHTSSQTTLDDQRRRTNVQGIFAVRNPQQLQGRHILLIDDVITTGSTMLSCAETIAAASGQVRISLLCLALAGHS